MSYPDEMNALADTLVLREKELSALRARVTELEAELAAMTVCATQHEIARMDFICQSWTAVERYERDHADYVQIKADLAAEREAHNAAQARCEALEWLVEVQTLYMDRLRHAGGWSTPWQKREGWLKTWERRSASNDELRATYKAALAAVER